MFVPCHKHEHLKGLIGQGGPLRLQDVLALAEGASLCNGSSCHLVFLLHAGLYLQLHGLFNSTDAVQVIWQRAEQLLGPLKQRHHM
jgi:hypothetical protein